MKPYHLILLCAGAAAFLTSFVEVSAAIRYVPSQYPSVQLAVEAAVNGDTVLVADGTYYENVRFRGKAITVASHYLIDRDTTHIQSTIVNGSRPAHPDSGSTVFFIDGEDTTSVLCGMTITGGTGSFNPAGVRVGGGVWVRAGSSAKLCHNRITANTLSHPDGPIGAGISAGGPQRDGGWLVLEENEISGNAVTGTTSIGAVGVYCALNARIERNRIEENEGLTGEAGDAGAGLCCYTEVAGGKDLILRGNIIRGNRFSSSGMNQYGESGLGGGMVVSGFRGVVESNIIADNRLEGPGILYGGGAMLLYCGDLLKFCNNWISGNRLVGSGDRRGGGVCIWQGSPTLCNNIVVGNEGAQGGGVYVGGTAQPIRPVLINNTICSNSAVLGSGMYSAGATPVVLNSILWNQGADIHESGGEVTVRYSDVRGSWTGVGNIDDDPAFLDTTYSLDTTSPCIAAGIDSTDIGGVWYFAPPSSFYGSIRPDPPGTPPDMGACESPEPSTGGVPEPGGSRPERFALEQNYPNPFNPGTVIRFVVPGSSEVRLSVVDILGREVSVWIHERLDAGVHEVVFDGSRCASGVYLYRLQAGGFIQTHRMLLLR